MTTRIIAVDPGGTTGLATALFHDGRGEVSGFKSFEETDPMDAVHWVHQTMIHGPLKVELVAERYTITPRTTRLSRQYDALYVIGGLMYVAHILHVPFTLQTPADAKNFASNAKLEAIGWRRPTKGGHADDAARHLLKRAVDTGLLPAEAVA